MNRKFGVVILAIIAVLCLSLGACNIGSGSTGTVMTKEEALKKYIFVYEDSLVSDEFTLPRKIGGYRATWTSDSEYVVLEQRTDDYLATPVLPEEGQVSVNLTVDLRGVSDTYTVRVKAITAQDIADNYSFRQDKQVVYESFDLDLVASYKGKAADITWSVDSGNNISVGEDGDECIVVPSSLSPTVSLKAEFSYNGEVATKVYTFTVSEEMEHLQQVNYWYTNTGVSVTMKGYVVEIASPWSSTYGDLSLYMIDENLDAGYYLFQVECDAANAALLKPGVYITVEGTTNTSYNGLMETNKDGTITSVDPNKTIDLSETVYAIDNDVIAGAPAANYNQSRLVSLTGWKVDSVYKNAPSEGATSTLFTLKKGDAKVSVAVSKYLEGAYTTKKTDSTWSDFVTLYNSFKAKIDAEEEVYVNVKGILGNYNGAQILPLSASDIEIVSAETENTVGAKVKSAIAKVDTAFDKIPAIVAVDGTKSYELPLDDSVEISYRIIGNRSTIELTEVDGKKALKFTPDFAEVANIDVTFTLGDYVAHKFYSVRAEKLDDQGKADWEIKNFVVNTEIIAAGGVTLPDASFFEEASVVWTSSESFAVVNGNVLTVSLPLTVKVLKLTATVTVGNATSTRDYYVKVSAYDAKKPVYVDSETAPVEGTYLAYALYQGNISKTLYALGTISNNYLDTTTDYTKAAKVTLTAVDGGYTIKLGDKYLELVLVDTSVKTDLKGEPTDGFVWKWNENLRIFVANVNSADYYVGAYKDFETFSASKSSYLPSTTSFAAQLVSEVKVQTAQDLLDEIVANIPTSATEDFALDFKASYELKEGSNGIVLDGLTAKVTKTASGQTATLIVSLTYGGETASSEVVITIPANNPAPADGNYIYGLYQAKTNKKLYIDSSLTITSGAFATTTDSSKAAVFTLTAVQNGFLITVNDKVLEVAKVINGTKTYYDPVLCAASEATNTPWKWNAEASVMTYTVDGTTYYLGAYSYIKTGETEYTNKEVVSASTIDRITGSAAAIASVGVTQFPCYFETAPETPTPTPSTKPAPEAGTYVYGIEYDGKVLYLTDVFSTENPNRLTLTEDATAAATVSLEKSGDGYIIQLNGKYLETSSNAIKLLDTRSDTLWKWDETNGWLTFTSSTTAHLISYVKNGSMTDCMASAKAMADDFVFELMTAPTGGGDEEEYETKTLAEFIALGDDPTKFYKIEGVIVNIANTEWGNIYITDGVTTIYVYGLCSSKMEYNSNDKKFNNVKDFASLNLKVGMHVVLISTKGSYYSVGQAAGSGFDSSSNCSDLEMLYVAQYNVKVPTSVNADFALPSYEGVTITWTSDNSAIAIDGTSATVTQSETEQTVTLTAVYTYLTATATVTYTVKVPAKISGDVDSLTFNFVDGADISDWNDWNNSYIAREVNANGVLISFSRADKQGTDQIISDRPVLATKGSTEYITLNLGSLVANGVTFSVKQWDTKTFKSIVIEYSNDGVTWTKAATTGSLSGECEFTASFESATYVRLSVEGSGSKNVQLAISGITVTLAQFYDLSLTLDVFDFVK